MKLLQFTILIPTFLLLSFSCDSSQNESVNQEEKIQEADIAKDITIEEFKKMLNEQVIILDVRTPEEFKNGHLKNAVNINYFDEDFISQVSKLDKSKPLLIHCAKGGRSSGAMAKLKGIGFSKMYNMLGGYTAWNKAGYETIK